MSEELKPCPFCGGPVKVEYLIGHDGGPWITCDNCRRNFVYYNSRSDIDYWNTRPVEDALRAQLAAATAQLQAYRDDRQRVMAEQCAPDERHCTCVPGLREEVQQAKAYVTALVEAMTAEQFCALVDSGKVDGIRAWLEGGE